MKKSTRIIGTALATMMVASTLAVGGVSASAASVKKPKSVKAKNTAKGIKITWKKVKGAKKYRVYRGKKKLTATKKTTYTDKKAKAGKTYKYTVKAVKGKKVSKKSKAAKVVRLTKPVITSAGSVAAGAKVEWKKVKGAKKYYVYSGSTKVATTTKLNYTYTKVVSGKTYSFKVKAVNGKSTSVASSSKSFVFLATPVVTAKVEGDKVVLSWDKVEGATVYQIRKESIGEPGLKNVDKTAETTFTADLGSNPTVFAFAVYALTTDASGANAYASDNGVAQFAYFPENSYFTDANGDLHVKLTLKKGESYNEGQYIVGLINAADYAVSIDDESAKVASVKENVITGVSEGTATVKVELKTADAQKIIYDTVCNVKGAKFGNELKTGVVYVDVTVVA